MKKNYLLFSILVLFFTSCSSEIECNEFDLSYKQNGSKLIINLNTDLPDYTDIMFSVSRDYTEKGSDTIYNMDYFSKKMTVSDFSQPIEVDISDVVWITNSKKHREEMEAFDLGYEVGSVEDDIIIRAVVPINQTNLTFGEENINLTGSKVQTEGMKVIVDEKVLNIPMKRPVE